MLETYRKTTLEQYKAAFLTLEMCIDKCPDSFWNEKVHENTFNQSVFHALFFGDLYLGLNPEVVEDQDFHRKNADTFAGYEELESNSPAKSYEKAFTKSYLNHCVGKAESVMAGETEESLKKQAGFSWMEFERAGVHPYNIRHIQHHAAQLILRLRQAEDLELQWFRAG